MLKSKELDQQVREFKSFDDYPSTHKRKERRKAHKQRRTYMETIADDGDLEREAHIIYKRWPNYPPDPFLETTSKKSHKMRDALENGEGWANRLIDKLELPYVYNLHAKHLGLPPECADPINFYCPKNRDRWKEAVQAAIKPPLHWKLELAERIHLHLIADRDAGLLHIPRDGELIKVIDNLEGWLLYISKPAALWNARNLALRMLAERRLRAAGQKRFVPMGGTMGIPNRKQFRKQKNALLES